MNKVPVVIKSITRARSRCWLIGIITCCGFIGVLADMPAAQNLIPQGQNTSSAARKSWTKPQLYWWHKEVFDDYNKKGRTLEIKVENEQGVLDQHAGETDSHFLKRIQKSNRRNKQLWDAYEPSFLAKWHISKKELNEIIEEEHVEHIKYLRAILQHNARSFSRSTHH